MLSGGHSSGGSSLCGRRGQVVVQVGASRLVQVAAHVAHARRMIRVELGVQMVLESVWRGRLRQTSRAVVQARMLLLLLKVLLHLLRVLHDEVGVVVVMVLDERELRLHGLLGVVHGLLLTEVVRGGLVLIRVVVLVGNVVMETTLLMQLLTQSRRRVHGIVMHARRSGRGEEECGRGSLWQALRIGLAAHRVLIFLLVLLWYAAVGQQARAERMMRAALAIGALILVNAHVSVEVSGLGEAQLAELALVGLLAAVHPHVLRQGRRVREGLSAIFAPSNPKRTYLS